MGVVVGLAVRSWFGGYVAGIIVGSLIVAAVSLLGHAECKSACLDHCDDIVRSCMAKCDKLPDAEQDECRDACYAGEARDCYHHCEEGHHDPSC